MKRLTYIALLLIAINCRRYVYKCEDDGFKDEQCMKMEELGTNTFIWLKKCKGAQVCVRLPYYGKIKGACSIKVRSHYDGESCANNNKCTSGVCDGTKCKGKTEGERCEAGLGQCKKGLLCRNEVDSNGDLLKDANSNTIYNFLCQKPIDDGGKCGNDYFDGQDLDDDFIIFYEDYYFDPAQNPCKLGSVCDAKSEKCVKIGSIQNGVEASNPLACQSGLLKYNRDSNTGIESYT